MTTVKILAATSAAGLILAEASPLDGWTKVALDAPLIALLWWAIAKTIPTISADHREAVSKISAEIREASARTNDLLEKALDLDRREYDDK